MPDRIAARAECKAPSSQEFVLRFTLPVEEQRYLADRSRCPFCVVDGEGAARPTQWEIVTRDSENHALVCEVLAFVPRGATPPGERASYALIEQRPPWADLDFHQGIAPFFGLEVRGPDGVPRGGTVDLAKVRVGAFLSTRRINQRGFGSWRTLRWGPVAITTEHSGILPVEDPVGETRPRRLGFRAWVTFLRASPVALVDLLLHDAFARSPCPDLFFRSIEWRLPEDFDVAYAWPEPSSAKRSEADEKETASLIALREDGRLHAFLQRQRREWRLAIFPRSARSEAEELLAGAGFGVCRPGIDPEDPSRELASWWNRATANFQAQRMALPDLSHVEGLEEKQRRECARVLARFQSGEPLPDYNKDRGAIGFVHPWGVPYGGMTGGSEIHPWEGVELAATGEPSALLWYQAWHRAVTDRHAVGLYEESGEPIALDRYLAADGSAPWTVYDGLFLGRADPLGLRAAAQQDAGAALPSSEIEALRAWRPIDYQHLIRRAAASTTLVWLSNDMIARAELQVLAELGRMWLFEGKDGELASLSAEVLKHPSKGLSIGRAHGWILHTAASAYSLADDAWRERWRDWFSMVRGLLISALTPTGLLQANSSGKMVQMAPYEGRYRVLQTIEHGILAHGAMGLLRSVFPRDAVLQRLIVSMGCDGVAKYLWDGDSTGTYQFAAVGPMDLTQPVFEELPSGLGLRADSSQIAATLAYALALSDSEEDRALLMRRIRQYCGGVDPFAWLHARGLENMESRAPLLAALQ